MPRKMKYEVRVYRRVEEQYVDIEVEATDYEKAQELAVKDAAKNAEMYFGDMPEPYFDADRPRPLFGTGYEE